MARNGMTDDDLVSLVRAAVAEAEGGLWTDLSQRRTKALAFYEGDHERLASYGLGYDDKRSKVVDRSLSDAIGWLLPSMMRVFANGERVVQFVPQGEEDEEAAKQATDYVNFLFSRECDGYRVLYNGIFEAFLFGNGIVKHWWDDSAEYTTEDFSGLDDEEMTALLDDEGVELLSHEAEPSTQVQTDPETGMEMPLFVTLHRGKLRRIKTTGRLKVVSIPPEEFLIENGALTIAEAKFVGHRSMVSRAALIAAGFDEDVVMGLPTGTADFATERTERWDSAAPDIGQTDDALMQEVEVVEAYIRADYDGDKWPEWRKVVLAGGAQSEMLANDEWAGEPPFSDVCVIPRPHRWDGRSLMDELEDVQKVRTVLMRQTLDNLYLQNLPQRAVLVNGVENPDELVNPTLGGVVFEKTTGAVRDLTVPFVAANSFEMLQLLDQVVERRTGVSRTSMALDPEVLQNQTATGVAAAQSAAMAKTELFARNAAMGLRRMFRQILRLVVAHQDKEAVIRLRGQWVKFDPRAWNAEMDADVSVGLGSGSRDRDLMLLQQISAQQKEIIGIAGPMNPIAGIDKATNTLRKMVEVAGINNADPYFADVTAEEVAAWMQENMSDQGPSPEEVKAQAQGQLEQMKMQFQMQLEQFKAEMASQREAAQMQADLEVRKAEVEADTIAKRQQAELDHQREQARMQFEMLKLQADLQIKREQMAQDRALELMKMGVADQGEDAETGEKQPSIFAGMAQSMADAMGQHSAAIAQQLASMMAGQTETILRAMSAPKRVVRGPDGRALGVETVME